MAMPKFNFNNNGNKKNKKKQPSSLELNPLILKFQIDIDFCH